MSLTVSNITYTVPKDITLVRHLSLQLEPGKIVSVCGPNGAGKSTLLKIMSGELRPSSGNVHLHKKAMYNTPHPESKYSSGPPISARERARTLGVLPQISNLAFPWLVHDVVAIGRLPWADKGQPETDRNVIRECMEVTDITKLASRKYPTLSGGEKQRVQLARVLAQLHESTESSLDGKILMLDEPTSALDIAHQHRVLGCAKEMASRGAAVFVILHDLNLAARYSDTMCLMKSGEIRSVGTPADVMTPETIGEIYDVQASIIPHPGGDYPLVVTAPLPNTPVASPTGIPTTEKLK